MLRLRRAPKEFFVNNKPLIYPFVNFLVFFTNGMTSHGMLAWCFRNKRNNSVKETETLVSALFCMLIEAIDKLTKLRPLSIAEAG